MGYVRKGVHQLFSNGGPNSERGGPWRNNVGPLVSRNKFGRPGDHYANRKIRDHFTDAGGWVAMGDDRGRSGQNVLITLAARPVPIHSVSPMTPFVPNCKYRCLADRQVHWASVYPISGSDTGWTYFPQDCSVPMMEPVPEIASSK